MRERAIFHWIRPLLPLLIHLVNKYLLRICSMSDIDLDRRDAAGEKTQATTEKPLLSWRAHPSSKRGSQETECRMLMTNTQEGTGRWEGVSLSRGSCEE